MTHRPSVVICRGEKTLAELVPRLGDGAEQAIAEGRVFVGARRALAATDLLHTGDEVAIYPAREGAGEPPRILAEQGGILALDKPAKMATIADQRGAAGTLQHWAVELAERAAMRPFPTSRLDVGVSGVVLFATHPDARGRLQRARAEGRYRRHYVAIAAAVPEQSEGLWTAPIGRDRDPRRRRAFGRDPVPAQTSYRVVARAPKGVLLAIEPKTGRTHQIRVHAAHAGIPLLGDAAYGGPLRLVSDSGAVRGLGRIALHAAWVEVPLRGSASFRVEAAVPDDLAKIWLDCGGDPSAWALAYRAIEPP